MPDTRSTILPRPEHGGLRRAAENLKISIRTLSRIWNRHQWATTGQAVRILQHPPLARLGLDFYDLTGELIEPGTPLSPGVVAARVEDLNDGAAS